MRNTTIGSVMRPSVLSFLATLSLMLIANSHTEATENTQTVQKELPAVKIQHLPTIDGILNDTCWRDAPQAIGFTDERTGKPAKN